MKFLNLGSKEAHAKPHHCIPGRWFNNCANVPQIADNTILWVLTLNTEVLNWKDWEIKKCDQQKWVTNLVLDLQKYQRKHSRLILTTRRFKKREKRKKTEQNPEPFLLDICSLSTVPRKCIPNFHSERHSFALKPAAYTFHCWTPRCVSTPFPPPINQKK